jgi:L-ascorbate metabolism protein UlaG (beta-lactamase superfamily)
MDIQFHGANCISIQAKKARIVVDDNLADLGAKSVAKSDDIALFTGPHGDPKSTPKIVIDSAGEYEVSEVSIYGVALRSHMDEAAKKNTTGYKVISGDMRLVVTGHIYPELTERQLEAFGTVDVLVIPVGGNGFTTDATGALKLIKKIEPKVVVVTHYDDPALKFEVPQQTLDQAIAGLGMEVKETVDRLKLKSSDLAEGGTKLIVINKS